MDQITHKKGIWNRCYELFCRGVSKGLHFVETGKYEEYRTAVPVKEEIAVNSRYLHRGTYCPSPVFHFVLVNSRRGRILSRPTKRSNITHRYKYNSEGIYLVEYYLNKNIIYWECIEWEENVRCGYVFDKQGAMCGISIETYESGKILNYMWATCRKGLVSIDKWVTDHTHYEEYQYKGSVLTSFDLYYCALIEEDFRPPVDVCELVDHNRYRVISENGQIANIESIEIADSSLS